MAFTKDEMIEILTKAKEMGMNSIRVDGIEANFGPALPPEETPPSNVIQDPAELLKILQEKQEYTDEEVLFYATPYFDELQAQKELRAKQIKEGLN